MLGTATSNHEGIVLVSVFSKYLENKNIKGHVFMKEESICLLLVFVPVYRLVYVPHSCVSMLQKSKGTKCKADLEVRRQENVMETSSSYFAVA